VSLRSILTLSLQRISAPYGQSSVLTTRYLLPVRTSENIVFNSLPLYAKKCGYSTSDMAPACEGSLWGGALFSPYREARPSVPNREGFSFGGGTCLWGGTSLSGGQNRDTVRYGVSLVWGDDSILTLLNFWTRSERKNLILISVCNGLRESSLYNIV